MTNRVRPLAVLACASALWTATVCAETESMEVVIGGGPNAGTYQLPSANIFCIHLKEQKTVAISYKDFDATDPKKIGVAAIGVTNPEDAGPKRGSVQVGFAGPDGKPGLSYSIAIPGDSPGPLTLVRNGQAAELTFQGKTKEGISIRFTAKCPALEDL